LLVGLGLCCCIVIARGQPATGRCAALPPGSRASQAREYLQHDRKGLEPVCVLYAIGLLGSGGSEPEAETLVKYLDVPPFVDDNAGVPRAVTGKLLLFPAVSALLDIGKRAVPSIVGAIGGEAVSEVARKNAIQALQLIYRDDPPAAVSQLVSAGRASSDSGASAKLFEAAREVAGKCDSQASAACQRILAGWR
jgi:hypothetical protein